MAVCAAEATSSAPRASAAPTVLKPAAVPKGSLRCPQVEEAVDRALRRLLFLAVQFPARISAARRANSATRASRAAPWALWPVVTSAAPLALPATGASAVRRAPTLAVARDYAAAKGPTAMRGRVAARTATAAAGTACAALPASSAPRARSAAQMAQQLQPAKPPCCWRQVASACRRRRSAQCHARTFAARRGSSATRVNPAAPPALWLVEARAARLAPPATRGHAALREPAPVGRPAVLQVSDVTGASA